MSDRPTLPPRLLQRLVEIVGADHVLTDAGLMAGFEVDWTRRFSGAASAVVRPADTAQVSAVLRALTDAGVLTNGAIGRTWRLVTHRDVDDADVDRLLASIDGVTV